MMKIRKINEKVSYSTAENSKQKSGVITFSNLAQFCRTIDLNYAQVRAAITQAKSANANTCKCKDWTFTWFYIEDIRNALSAKNIPITPQTKNAKVEYFVDSKFFGKDDKVFHGYMVQQGAL